MLASLGVPADAGAATFDALVKAYADPGRYYHNLDHLAAVLTELDAPGEELRPLVELAVWFHDAVYDPRASDNEERSARWAESACTAWGLPSAEEVGRLIRATRTHEAAQDDVNAQLLLDADLAILGADEAAYDAYAAGIRKEYAWVPEEDYRKGRTRVLEGFLRRDRIFRRERAYGEYESRARRNLAREIVLLKG
jgi:predicted metal-dependent HD superfamily phosphohydrolase